MRENLQCSCHICKIERHLVISLSDPHHSDEFLRLAHAAAPLATFPTARALVEHLHAHRDGEKSVPSASEVVGSLMQSSSVISETELRNSVLVLSFVPMIHRTYREVRAWFREIEAEDIAQQILTLFLELVDSTTPVAISNHLPIALTRTLRKNAFRWAEKEKRLTIQREFDKSQTGDEPGANDTFETVSVLNDFLDHCHRLGILSVFERELLIKLKVEGFFAKEIIHTHTALSEKAVHWRVERILQRLHKAAGELGMKGGSFSFDGSPQNPQQRKTNSQKAGSFSSGNQVEVLPISKSRRQLSLDSSPKQSESKQQQIAAAQRNLLSPITPTLSSASGRTAIRSSVLPPTLARHTKFGERLSSNPDAGLTRIIRKELAGNEEIPPQQIRFPLAPARVHRIFLFADFRNGCIRPGNRCIPLGERRQRFDAGVYDHYRAWSVTRLHCGRRLDLRVW
jgi:DNA-directed RNA polymerase specialized sigma24 family protein